MIRILAACALSMTGLAGAGAAAAETWGQPVYVSPYGRAVGGTPLSEVETRSYVNTGRWADGYSDQAYGYGYGYGHEGRRYGYGHRDDRRGYDYSRRDSRPQAGYRDVWGYNDDRHPAARGWSRDRRHDGDCDCADVYLYDR